MGKAPVGTQRVEQGKLLDTLERLLAIEALDVKTALGEASQLVAEAIGADKVDIFLYELSTDTLVAVGVSDTPMGDRQRQIGMDRLPVANGGHTVGVFQTGLSYLTGRADEDPDVPLGLTAGLGVRSVVEAPLAVGGERRGVLAAASAHPDCFSEDDLRFLEATSRWVGMVTQRAELTERVARDAAEAARRMAADELVTVLAHDLRNYLTPLRGRMELLRRQAQRDGSEEQVRHADEASRALDRLRSLVADLLDVGRLEQGLFALAPAPLDLAALLRETAESLGTLGSRVCVRSPAELWGQADPDRLRQAVENLVANALQHSAEGAPVHLELNTETRESGECAVITVRDEGPGIPEEMLPRLFTRFAPGVGSQGLGLGLYLARSVAEAHGGTLEAESPPGGGAVFRLTLPSVPA
jgi:signal transduction histidine kinase